MTQGTVWQGFATHALTHYLLFIFPQMPDIIIEKAAAKQRARAYKMSSAHRLLPKLL
jgi:hypothetical protein